MENSKKMSGDSFIEVLKKLEGSEFKRVEIEGKEYYIFPETFFQHASKRNQPGFHNTMSFNFLDEKKRIVSLSVLREDGFDTLIHESATGKRLAHIETHNKWHDILICFIFLMTVILSINGLK